MSFQKKPLIQLSRTAWYYKLYRACRDYMGYDDEAHTVCDLFRGYWGAVSWRIGTFLEPIAGWAAVGFLGLMCLGFFGLLGFGFWTLLQYWTQFYHGNLFLAGATSLGIALAIIIGTIVAGGTCLLVVALFSTAASNGWRFLAKRTGTAWYKVPAKRGSSFLRVVGQWLYDLAHGICSRVEII